MITTEQIKELRDTTSISVMQCKKALEEAGGDMKKALVILQKKSGEISAKKGDRTFRAGTVAAYVHSTGNVATMIELLCETDFVSDNEEFKTLARDIAMHITASNPKFLKKEDISKEDINTAKEVFMKEMKDGPKKIPKDMQEKILEGKIETYFSEMVLLNQVFIKNPELTIEALIQKAVQKFGEKIAVARFKRFKVLES
ncbi:MAG: elongation factor Ts [Patescibacteria group bacterium]